MKNFFGMMGLSYASTKGDARRPSYSDSRRASYSAVPADNRRRSSAARRQSYGANRRKSLDPASVLGRHLFDGRLTDPRTRFTCLISLMLIGFSALFLGTLIAVFDPFQLILKWKLVMVKGDETFEMWKTPEAAVYLKVYIFNVTNREDFLSGRDEKLRFQEVGPYVYRENSAHKNVTFNSNDTLTMTPVFPLTWVPELNTGKEDDVLVLPNIALLSFASVMSEASLITRMGVNLLIRQTKSKPFVRQTAKEFMFGYESPLVTIGNKFLPSWIAFDKLGLIDRMYDFTGDSATIYTGSSDVSKSGTIENYNRRPYLPQWPAAPCNKVTGASDGTKFPSVSENGTQMMFFRKSLCRAIPMVKTGKLFLHDGLPVNKYIFENGSLDNGAENPANKCFCRKNKCLKPGLIDVTDCYYGFPIALSYPHFYQSDQSILDAIEGMTPDQKQHETYFLINPETGMPTQLYVRMQINIALGDISDMANTEHCSNLVIPLVWTEIGFEKLPDHMLNKFFVYLRVGPVVLVALKYALLVGGVAFIALTVLASLFIPIDDELRYRNSSAWRRESQTLTARDSTPTIRMPIPAAAVAGKEMNTYYNSMLDGDGAAAARLNDDLCSRLDVVHEVRSLRSSCTGSEFEDEDDDDDRII
ncbi:PREDICTED: scavenger receptor class B member 1-like isoform X1 [Diuraphis noxia]|uniref:scavenger receptor class B member 1-like isoform X1 n=1 Tax=Diuraphis noxia TaxID=143948 RepID=UPI0007637018|nr:PREDICTED: scavenger receptor class B member 1-like isoform X1 [Diuraphis noxia]